MSIGLGEERRRESKEERWIRDVREERLRGKEERERVSKEERKAGR